MANTTNTADTADTPAAIRGRVDDARIAAARQALAELALPPPVDDQPRAERIAKAVARLVVKQVGGPLLAPRALWPLLDRDVLDTVRGYRTKAEAARTAAAASALTELCVLAIWSDGKPRKAGEIASDLADGVWAMVDQGETERAGELLATLLDEALLDAAAPAGAEGAA